MRIKIFVCPILICSIAFLSCSKDRPNNNQNITIDTTALLSARWSLLKDSVYNDGNFYFLQGGVNYYPTPGQYIGTANDYYEFQSSGNLLVSENNQSYSSPYKVFPNSKLVINDLLVYDTASIVLLTSENATFDWSATSSNGGKYYKRVYLKK